MLISTKGRYVLAVLVELAKKKDGKFIPLKVLAEAQNLSQKYLESIFKPLCISGYVEGVRGKFGGYKLKIAPEDISVYEIVNLVEDGIVPVTSLYDKSDISPNEENFMWLWEGLEDGINTYLKTITLKDLLEGNSHI